MNKFPGVLLTVAASALILVAFPHGLAMINTVLIALICGLVVGNLLSVPDIFLPGIKFTVKSLLKVAIILLGVSFNFRQLLELGLGGLLLIVSCLLIAGVVAAYLGPRFKLSSRLAVLIGVGSAICGNSAIMAAAPVIRAKDEEITMAVSTITFIGTLSAFAFPLVGNVLGINDYMFGFWSGTSINDTSQVIAASFAFSQSAGEVAALVKLTRNLLMGPILLLIGVGFAQSERGTNQLSMKKVFPYFVLGFLGLASLNTLGFISAQGQELARSLSLFIVHMVLVGVGLSTDLRLVKRMGLSPFALGIIISLVISLFSLGVLLWVM